MTLMPPLSTTWTWLSLRMSSHHHHCKMLHHTVQGTRTKDQWDKKKHVSNEKKQNHMKRKNRHWGPREKKKAETLDLSKLPTPALTALCCWLWFFYRESFATTHRFCISKSRSRRTRWLRWARRERGRALECQGTRIVNGSTTLRKDKREMPHKDQTETITHI